MTEQLRAREHFAGPAHEHLEQRVLLRRELDLPLAAPHLPGCGIQAEVAHAEHDGPLDRAATRERAQPRQQLTERERLRHIVVSAGVQPGDPVLDGHTGGEHQYRGPHPGVPEPPADGEAVQPGKHDIQDDRVVDGLGSHPQPVVAGHGDVGDVPLLGEASPEQGSHLRLVLDDQEAHGDACRPCA